MLRDNRNDAELQREFKKPRFLWVITERYHIAKKTGSITGDFWEGLKEALDQFESGWEGEEEVEVEMPEPNERRRADINRRAPEPSGISLAGGVTG